MRGVRAARGRAVSAPVTTVNSMRILHTSDWHLGRRLHGVDLTGEHRAFLDWLHALVDSRAIDVVAIAGDVYDRAIPHPDALEIGRASGRERDERTGWGGE